MCNLEYLANLPIRELAEFVERSCPPELPGDDPYDCPYEVKENCKECWFRWLKAEHD